MFLPPKSTVPTWALISRDVKHSPLDAKRRGRDNRTDRQNPNARRQEAAVLDIIMIVICIVLLLNLVATMSVMGYRTRGNSWLLAVLLTGTSGAAIAAMIAVVYAEEPSRFVDLSLVLMGLAALPVVMRVMLTRTTSSTDQGGGHDH